MLAYLAAGLVAAAAIAFFFDGAEEPNELDRLLAMEKDLDRLLAEAYARTSVDCPAKACMALQLRGESLGAVSEAMTCLDHVLEVHPEFASRRVSGRTVPEIMQSVLGQKTSAAS
jgi:hypothetical protein